jgi:long-chain acyl-CoA synthetase
MSGPSKPGAALSGTPMSAYEARLARLVTEFSDQSAALYQGESYSWGYVGRIDAFLRQALAQTDSVVSTVLILRQRPNCVASTMALWAQGRCVNLMSPLGPDEAIVAEIVDLAPGIVIADSDDWARPGLSDACRNAICVELRSELEQPIALYRPPLAVIPTGTTSTESHAVRIATSGTTGKPKRFAISWEDLAPAGIPRDPSAGRGVMINVLPLFSIGGARSIAATLFSGRPIALMDKLDVVEWAGLIRDHRPRRAGAPPAVLRMVLDAKIPPEWLASVKLIYTASAPLSMELADEFEATYGIPIIQGYGATEFLGAVTGWPGDSFEKWGAMKRGSVGLPIPGVKLRVVDSASGTVLGPNAVGNLEVDSPYRVKGVPAGWAATNDLARVDEDGFVWILGRGDDVIIRGGFKVHLLEVEAALLEHPLVLEACVVGLPDERLGEVPAALVITDASEPPDEADLIAAVRRKLAPYMAPVLVSRHGSMPLNSMLKRDRRFIVSLLQAELDRRKLNA